MSIERELRDHGVLVVTISDPARRNPVGHAVRQELLAALSEAEADQAVRAVVLTGAEGQFSAGGDIRDQQSRSIAQHRDRMAVIRDLVLRMVRYSKPLVAAVEGWAAGGGFSLALACPTVVASRQARFVAGFTRIGLIPDMGLLATLPARIGPARARRVMLTNQVIEAPEALDMGMVDLLADPGQALEMAVSTAAEEAAAAPLPRHFITDWFARDIAQALDYEQSLQPGLLNSEDAAEGRAAFRDKRQPNFQGC
ncbi:enoyl-CoA hydratase/isomerase family protein [Paracoccus fistulariae]|uniref:Enoyl-CoA hydratase/isomerase family protein n=1 Tax=Paracoccus fistulariae TaxID=658446 RepID=A0ABY7SNM2_9RHOB|nr:enoyl-CoA hydratase/isomerase family protein [Paracoccus fistulariae]MDB6180406.1 enoyl-CoA hydratase/isomerase family protein [Paracoccus fistulariae]WCR08485.1 enoyl-CoA hydratase/isomerase family protein [Paracoccus fistulariae]